MSTENQNSRIEKARLVNQLNLLQIKKQLEKQKSDGLVITKDYQAKCKKFKEILSQLKKEPISNTLSVPSYSPLKELQEIKITVKEFKASKELLDCNNLKIDHLNIDLNSKLFRDKLFESKIEKNNNLQIQKVEESELEQTIELACEGTPRNIDNNPIMQEQPIIENNSKNSANLEQSSLYLSSHSSNDSNQENYNSHAYEHKDMPNSHTSTNSAGQVELEVKIDDDLEQLCIAVRDTGHETVQLNLVVSSPTEYHSLLQQKEKLLEVLSESGVTVTKFNIKIKK
jgi:hypothetical protein